MPRAGAVSEGICPASGWEYREAARAGVNDNCPFEGACEAKAALAAGVGIEGKAARA